MTICDAAKYLEGLFADKNVGDDIEGIVQEEIEAAQVAVWLLHDRMRRDALQPLDENGLARCGCGGKARLGKLQYTIADPDLMPEYYAYCQDCGITTENSADRERVEAAWNLAMSGQTAEQKPVKTRNETPPKPGVTVQVSDNPGCKL